MILSLPRRLGLGRLGLGLVIGSALLVTAPSADAVGTRHFDLESQDDFLGGEMRGVAVDSQGRVRAGWNLGSITLPNVNSVWSALEQADGSVLLGTGNTGKVLRVAAGQVSEYADTKQLAVTSLVAGKGGAVFAATMPNGKIFRLDAANKMTELPAIADADHVWALAYDPKKDGFYAATGPNGKLFFVQPGGQAQLVFDSDEPNLTAVAVADDGAVYAGSTGKGLLYKVTGPGRASILLDPPGDEVKAIAVGRGGSLYVVCNEMGEGGGGGSIGGSIGNSSSGGGGSHRGGMPSFSSSGGGGGGGKVGKGALLKVEQDGRFEELLARKDTHFVSLALDDQGRPFVGTGAEGRVYTVDDNHTSTMMADTDERQIGTIVLGGKTRFIASSDPAMFHEIHGTGGADATWTSKVLDAGLRANFGRLFWRSEGAVEMSTRTGNSATPDATWSDWSQGMAAPSKPSSPPGRYAQVRARFAKDPNALLRELTLPFVTDNQRAVVTQIEASNRKGAASSSSGGHLPASGADVPAHTTMVKVSWKTDNPDGDQLRFRVQFRFDGQGVWRDLVKPDEVFTKSEAEWETASLPEGIYRIRVEATDELANPPDRVTRHALESGPVLVDNTPPVFRALSAAGTRIKAEVVDGIGPIARIDFAVDGRTEWRPLLPKDGVYDEAAEEIDIDLGPLLSPGSHLIAVRAFDQAGNQVVRDIEIKGAAPREVARK